MIKKIVYVFLALFLFSSQVFCTPQIVTAEIGGSNVLYDSIISYEAQDDDFLILYLKGATIPTGNANYIDYRLTNIYHWDHIDFTILATDGDSITTADVSYEMPGQVKSTNETLTSGTPITYLKGNTLRFRIYNPSANVETVVTLDIRVAND